MQYLHVHGWAVKVFSFEELTTISTSGELY